MGRVYEALKRAADKKAAHGIESAGENDGAQQQQRTKQSTASRHSYASQSNARKSSTNGLNADESSVSHFDLKSASPNGTHRTNGTSHDATDLQVDALRVLDAPYGVVKDEATEASVEAYDSSRRENDFAPPLTYDEIARESSTAQSRFFNFDEYASATESPAASQMFLHADDAAHDPASNEQTEETRTGAALHVARESRAAGATLDARSSARSQTVFPSLEIAVERVEPHLIAINNPRSPLSEQYRSLRTRLMQAAEANHHQIFVVSSVKPAEGKTVSSLNLAWLLAQSSGVRTLLIDADLRRPCTGEYLGLDSNLKGLSEIFDGKATLEESVVRLEPAGLHLLPGGAPREDVADLLSGSKFKQLLAEARLLFDYIIIDAPPLGIFTDAAMLINLADSALLVVRSGHVKYTALERLLETIPQNKILGIVLNGSEEKLDEDGYYYQRKYYRTAAAEGSPIEA